MKMDVLRCETVAGVSKELLMFALVYNLVRLVMLEASRRQGVPRGSDQFRGCVALAGRGPSGGRLAEVGGQSRSCRPRRAPREETPTQAVSTHDKTTI